MNALYLNFISLFRRLWNNKNKMKMTSMDFDLLNDYDIYLQESRVEDRDTERKRYNNKYSFYD